MKINFSTQIESIKALKRQLTETRNPSALIHHFDALKESLDRSRGKERKLAAQVLTELDTEIENANLDDSTTQLLHDRIHELQAAILQKSEEKLKPPIPVKLAIIFGLDPNSAMAVDMYSCLSGKLPFITTKSILCRADIEENIHFKEMHNKKCKNLLESGWHIYQQVDEKLGDQFLVCLPQGVQLKDLDLLLKPESGSKLVPISATEAMNGPHDFYRFEALAPLLSANASHDKMISIHAHGEVGKTLGLNTQQLNDLMTLLSKQRCVIATFQSCYSGGESALQLFSENSPLNAPPFPVIAQSIGDYPTQSGQNDNYLHAFSKELETALRHSSGNTVAALRKAIMKAEEGMGPKTPVNQMQVYFPQSREPVQGYRALSESTTSFSLTLAKLREAQISHSNRKITINNISILTLYPTLIDATLSIMGSAPTLRSTIPGRARHAIEEIEMKDASLTQFIDAQKSFLSEKLGVNKTFFIKKMRCRDGVYENVVVLCEAKKLPKIFYKMNNKYYLVAEQKKSITPFHYAIEVSSAYRLTEPSPQALRVATAGQESIDALKATWVANPFEGDFSPCNLDRLPKMTEVQANSLLRSLSSSNKGRFLYYLLTHGRIDLVEKLVKKGTIPLDTVSLSGDTLLHLAIRNQSTTLFDYLLTQKIDCNARGADDNTPLHLALQAGSPEFAKRLLETTPIILTTKNKSGYLPIYYGDCTPEVWDILLKKMSDPFTLSTIVQDYCKRPNPPMESIETLLKAGADANLGAPTAFEVAFKSGNLALTALLLKYGAKPFEKNEENRIPFNGLLKSTPRSALIRYMSLPESKLELRKNLDNFNTFLATAHSRSDPLITGQLMNVIDVAAFSAEDFNSQIERKNYVFCAYLIMAGFNSIAKDAAGNIPLINFLEKASSSLSKDYILAVFDSMNVDWNLVDSEGKKLYQLVLSAIRAYRVETYCILLRKGMRLEKKTLQSKSEMKIYIKNLEILQALIETHGPLTPETTQVAYKILIDYSLDYYEEDSFKAIQTYVDRGFLNWSLELEGGNTIGSLITNDIICHKPFETDDSDYLQAHRKHCNKRVTQTVAFCLKHGVDPNWIRARSEGDIQPQSFIEMAIRDQNKPLVDLLVKSGLKKETFERALETIKASPALLEWANDNKPAL